MAAPSNVSFRRSGQARQPSLQAINRNLSRLDSKIAQLNQPNAMEIAAALQKLKGLRVCSVCHHAQKDDRFYKRRQHECPGPCPGLAECNHPKRKIDPTFEYKPGHELEIAQSKRDKLIDEKKALEQEQKRKVSCRNALAVF